MKLALGLAAYSHRGALTRQIQGSDKQKSAVLRVMYNKFNVAKRMITDEDPPPKGKAGKKAAKKAAKAADKAATKGSGGRGKSKAAMDEGDEGDTDKATTSKIRSSKIPKPTKRKAVIDEDDEDDNHDAKRSQPHVAVWYPGRGTVFTIQREAVA